MCIRDRYEIVRMTFKETNIVVLGLSSLAGALLYLREEILGLSQYGIVSVSYTHLDVYKRQVYNQ